jgi:hypothetical protein
MSSAFNAMPFYDGLGNFPGMSTVLESVENSIWYGRLEDLECIPAIIDGAARDVGNTNNTTRLRPGLLLGQNSTTGEYAQWNPNATDGTSRIAGVLAGFLTAQRNGANTDNWYYIIRRAPFRAGGLIVPGTTNPGIVGNALEWMVVNQLLESGSRLDRFYNTLSMTRPYTADATLVAADLNITVTNLGAAGATTLTLPAPVRGARLKAVNVAGAFAFTLAAGANNLNAANSSIALNPVGDTVELLGVATAIGTPDTIKWVVMGGNGYAIT